MTASDNTWPHSKTPTPELPDTYILYERDRGREGRREGGKGRGREGEKERERV